MFTNINYRSSFKIASKGRVLLCISAIVSALSAAPSGGVVTSGSATISNIGKVTNIDQSSNKASINWQGFGIAPSESVNFNQPNKNSLTLNRVIGNEKSVIEGALNANGKVFIINSNGVLFTKGSSVNTAGLVASTLDISDEDFNNNNFVFKSNGNQNSVINLGTITINDNGYAALLGNSVKNEGVIIATKGVASLNSADKITLNFNGDSLLNISIDEGTLNSLVENKGAIYADGGKIILSAKSANELLLSQVNVEGVLRARSIDDLVGDINIYAHNGKTNIDATLDASAPINGNGGFIETSGDSVKISDSSVVTTKSTNGKSGTWLIDPNDFTIGIDGDMSGTTLSNNLENGNVIIESSQGKNEGKGDIHVNDKVEWSSNNKLTLDAYNDININNRVIINGKDAILELIFGNDYNILTPASYSGTTLDKNGKPIAKVDPHDPKNGGDGIYGSITYTNKDNKQGLIINGVTYTLIHDMDELDGIDGIDGVTNLFTDGTPADSKINAQENMDYEEILQKQAWSNWFGYYDPDTQDYTIPTKVDGSGACGSNTCYYNPETKLYDLTAQYNGNIKSYYQDSNGDFTIASYDIAMDKYYNPSSEKYDLANEYPNWQKIYKDSNGEYTKYSSNGEKYYNPVTDSYDLDVEYPSYVNMFYNDITDKYDIYGANFVNGEFMYYDPTTKDYSSIHNIYYDYFYYNPDTKSYNLISSYSINGNYALANNLDASGKTYTNSLINSFDGTFAGLGHTIDGLKVVNNEDVKTSSGGLIGKSQNIVIRDLGLVNIKLDFTNNENAGSFLGQGAGTLKNIYSTGTIDIKQGIVGGIAGMLDGNIYSSFSDVEIIANQRGAISGGGLAGKVNNGEIVNSHATGDFLVTLINRGDTAQNIGGLVGQGGHSIINSYATGNVIVKFDDGVEPTSHSIQYIGGLAGNFGGDNGVIINSFATGNVAGGRYLGGLIGSGAANKIENVYATGDVTSLYTTDPLREIFVGGLFGYIGNINNDIHINNVFSTGDVTVLGGGGTIGGLIGGMGDGVSAYERILTNAYSTGNIWVGELDLSNPYADSVGGLIGKANGYDISNVYATGDVTGHGRVGGLIGALMNSKIKDSYSTGTATSYIDDVGGSFGYISKNEIDNVYYNSETNDKGFASEYQNDEKNINGLTSEESNYIDQLINGEMTLDEVKADIVKVKEEQAVFDEKVSNALTQAEQIRVQPEKEQLSKQSIFNKLKDGFFTSQIDDSIIVTNVELSDASYTANVKTISVDGKTYNVEDDNTTNVD